jgi:hypothetical protein
VESRSWFPFSERRPIRVSEYAKERTMVKMSNERRQENSLLTSQHLGIARGGEGSTGAPCSSDE